MFYESGEYTSIPFKFYRSRFTLISVVAMKSKLLERNMLRNYSRMPIAMYSLCVMFCVSIACVTGRFGSDCDRKCHCKKVTYDCQATNGRCNSGCAQYFTGDTCQGNPLCILPDVFYVQL